MYTFFNCFSKAGQIIEQKRQEDFSLVRYLKTTLRFEQFPDWQPFIDLSILVMTNKNVFDGACKVWDDLGFVEGSIYDLFKEWGGFRIVSGGGYFRIVSGGGGFRIVSGGGDLE